jgi:hypothetical protein
VPEQKPGETVEGRLADAIEAATDILDGGCAIVLTKKERVLIAKCLRERARWMASDIYAGERPGRKRQRR